MHKDPKILILYASYGNGHFQVSRALKQGLLDQGYTDILMIDLFQEAHPWIDALTRYIYIKSFSFAPFFLYGWTYYLTRNMNNKTIWSHYFHTFGAAKLQEILQIEKPDLVVNTFPMQVLPELRKSKGIRVPTINILTDFCLHNRWIHSEIDRYYVATEDLMAELVGKGVSPDKVFVSGIPIMKQFDSSSFQTKSPCEYGLNPNNKICLVLANSYSSSLLHEICRPFKTNAEVHMVLICGNNKKLKYKLENHYKDYANIQVLGFVEEIDQLMRMASCIITKAGGITLSEALALNLPILIFRPLPGQEKENAEYLSKKGAAITVNNVEELANALSKLLFDHNFLVSLLKGIKPLSKPDSTKTIIQDFLDYFQIKPKSMVSTET